MLCFRVEKVGVVFWLFTSKLVLIIVFFFLSGSLFALLIFFGFGVRRCASKCLVSWFSSETFRIFLKYFTETDSEEVDRFCIVRKC